MNSFWNKRALFALFCAIVVAISEAGLFLIWQWRKADATSKSQKKLTVCDKKVDPAPEAHTAPEDANENKTMRRRRK
jgi:hypothetical protein